jgi:hypothetical protein
VFAFENDVRGQFCTCSGNIFDNSNPFLMAGLWGISLFD